MGDVTEVEHVAIWRIFERFLWVPRCVFFFGCFRKPIYSGKTTWSFIWYIYIYISFFIFTLSWWCFRIFFIFHPYLGKWSNLTNIFQTGSNHQLVIIYYVMAYQFFRQFLNLSFVTSLSFLFWWEISGNYIAHWGQKWQLDTAVGNITSTLKKGKSNSPPFITLQMKLSSTI